MNAAAFQLGWFVCILLGTPYALVFTLAAFFLHFRFAPVDRRDWLSVCVAVPMGVLHDNLLWYFGVLDFGAVSNWGVAPFWLVFLWSLMALTFNHSLKWFYSRPWLLAIMGAIGGPMAYYGGIVLSGAQWGIEPILGWSMLAFIWVWLLPLHRWLVIQGERLCIKV